jgi:hypothetical protein
VFLVVPNPESYAEVELILCCWLKEKKVTSTPKAVEKNQLPRKTRQAPQGYWLRWYVESRQHVALPHKPNVRGGGEFFGGAAFEIASQGLKTQAHRHHPGDASHNPNSLNPACPSGRRPSGQ